MNDWQLSLVPLVVCPPPPSDFLRQSCHDWLKWQSHPAFAEIGWVCVLAKSFKNPPETVVWVLAPPSSSWVTSSLVTDFTTSGPVINKYEVSCHTHAHTQKMQSTKFDWWKTAYSENTHKDWKTWRREFVIVLSFPHVLLTFTMKVKSVSAGE